MPIEQTLGLLAIPLFGVSLWRYNEEKARTGTHALSKLLLRPLFLLLMVACCSAIQSGILTMERGMQVNWDVSLSPAPASLLPFCIAAGLLFVAAVVVEAKNQGNNYTVKRRFLKYTLQGFSAFSALLSVGILIITLAAGNGPQTLSYKEYFAASVATAALAYSGVQLIEALRNGYRFTTCKELRPNSKQLKALRKSPRA